MHRKLFATLALCAFAAAAHAATPPPAKATADPALDNDDKKTIYALGLVVSQNLAPFSLNAAELEVLLSGVRDGVTDQKPKVEMETYGPKIQALHQARMAAAGAAESKEAEAYVAKMAAEKGAKKEASGLVYVQMKPGTGASPKATDTVKVHYHGTLRDGSVFDSSVQRGEPAEFPVNHVIPCWTEAVQKMKVGEKAKITCPAAIAYGDKGAPPKIKPGAALTFEVELLEIKPPSAAPAAAPAPAPSHP